MAEKNLAVCFVSDVYKGLEGVPRGTIKYIRINEQVPRPWGKVIASVIQALVTM